MKVSVKRVYDRAEASDGYRVLVDRMWPRGLKREALPLDRWEKEIAPSTALRQWFGHDPERWDEFRRRYAKELASAAQRARLQWLAHAAGKKPLTLVYGAKDEEHNNAVALREILLRTARTPGPSLLSKKKAADKRRAKSR